MNIRHAGTLAAAVVFVAGCAAQIDPYAISAEKEAVFGSSQAELRPLINTLYTEGEWGAVLNLNRLAVAALEQGRRDLAAAALDASLRRIEAVYADNPDAERARSLWVSEGQKDFKGESYERAMAYYYRGLIYLAEGDYQNARASFLSAEFQDTVAAVEQYAGDFGMMNALAGWASHCDGDEGKATEYYEKAVSQGALLSAPSRSASVLKILEVGSSPLKQAAGKHQEILQIMPPVVSMKAAQISAGSTAPQPIGDISYQATTRGGRQVDTILAGKASFKDTTHAVGEAGSLMGLGFLTAASATNDPYLAQNMAGLSLASSLIGLVSSVASSATSASADARYWDNLPEIIHADFSDENAQAQMLVNGQDVRPVLDSRSGSCRIVAARFGAAVAGPIAPGNVLASDREQILARNQERDAAFRTELSEILKSGDQSETAKL